MSEELGIPQTVDQLLGDNPQLQDWFSSNMPDETKLRYAIPAQKQIMWIRDHLAYMIWCSLAPDGDMSREQRVESLTVDGTHISKSVLLPVYRFDVKGVTIKVRGNFHDWCVRCWSPMKKEFPDWMNVRLEDGFFEGMEGEDSPVSFCVRDRERLFAVVWWMLNEGI